MTQLFSFPVRSTESDERYTPAWLFAVMRETFDLDVAAPVGGVRWIPAADHYSPEDDGLAHSWQGFVWMNPPYSNAGPWADRFRAHGNGIALLPWSVNATWLHNLCRAVRLVVTLEHIRFDSPTHTGRHVPVAVALFALGERGETACRRVAEAGHGIAWNRELP